MFKKRRIQDGANGPTTYIAASTTIVGTITGQGAYVFCGTVEGDCDIERTADARRRRALERHPEGDRHRRGRRRSKATSSRKQRVEILGTARVTGSLSGNSIAVAEGADHRGRDQGDERRAADDLPRKAASLEPRHAGASSSASTARSSQLRKR